ncbi:MAG UNVERIFIED_CONTAM: hypothetical protein LVR18_44705 [Planctomycetaceae bacterium]|jgi:hypothetical protein
MKRLMFFTLLQFVILTPTALSQQASQPVVTVEFKLSAFDLKGKLLQPPAGNPAKGSAMVTVYWSQGSDNTKILQSLSASAFTRKNPKDLGLISVGSFNIGDGDASKKITLPRSADPNAENVLTLAFNRADNTLITAVVSYIPVLTEDVNGKKQFVANQEHTLKVVVPEAKAVEPCARAACSTVKKRNCFLRLK